MGGGMSATVSSVDELVATTFVIGHALTRIVNPGMYRIYDFHSPKAPKLKIHNTPFFAFGFEQQQEEEETSSSQAPIDPAEYEHFFNVPVGDDIVYIENPTDANEAGWTPLHACCMSLQTVQAGFKLIDEIVKCGGNIDKKTISGPGTFNKGWTPLQMACAYGIEPLVERLISEGADVNCMNCFGYTPLIEACHRGFINIVNMLIKAGADCNYIPDSDKALESPFINSPPHTALGEAARCGFPKIVKALIDAGADKDKPNFLGWTPLHEACFYNRVEVVKTLLLSGADATLRTKSKATPYHLSGLQMVRSMIEDMGGPGAVPPQGDVVDMIQILEELSMVEVESTIQIDADGGLEVVRRRTNTVEVDASQGRMKTNHSYQDAKSENVSSPQNDRLLHSGEVLGDLPALNSTEKKFHRHRNDQSLDRVYENNSILSPSSSPLKKKGDMVTPEMDPSELLQADDKKMKSNKKSKKVYKEKLPTDFPQEYLCSLTLKPMSEPVKSIYGNYFEKSVIMKWLNNQGKICPISGAPLSEIDLKPDEELGNKIRSYILQRSKGQPEPSNDHQKPSPTKLRIDETKAADDDLYDF